MYAHIEIKINDTWRTLYKEIRYNQILFEPIQPMPDMTQQGKAYAKIFMENPDNDLKRIISESLGVLCENQSYTQEICDGILIKYTKINKLSHYNFTYRG